jgi:UDP-N-acetylglucosamine 2-epimerase (non-hydrolysing)
MIYIVIGTRAQLIKMAPVIRLCETKGYPFTLLHTGQHFESLDEICKDFEIKTSWHSLYKGKEVSTIWQAILWCLSMGRLLISNKFYSQFVDKKNKNLILVHGDTLSTLLGAMIGKRFKIPVAHVESGLRSFNLFHPFPEEIIRLLTFRLSNIAFCPSEWAKNNLQNYPHLDTINTNGNTIIDSLNYISQKETEYSIPSEPYGVISIHRFENIFFRKRFKNILDQIINLAKQYKLVFVLHPATRKRLDTTGYLKILDNNPNIELRPRTNYNNFITLLSSSKFVISDGGSNQEELSIFGIPTYLMRKSTERQDGLERNIVLGEYSSEILDNFILNLEHYSYPRKKIDSSPTEKILVSLKQYTSIP